VWATSISKGEVADDGDGSEADVQRPVGC
jgi:hypothetical protein